MKLKKPAFLHTHIHTHHMALFGVPGHFSAAERTAWQLVMDEHTHTQSDTHTLATTEEPSGLWCPQVGLMTRRATGATDGPR